MPVQAPEVTRATRGATGASHRAGSFTNYSMWLLTGFCDSVTFQTELPVSADPLA